MWKYLIVFSFLTVGVSLAAESIPGSDSETELSRRLWFYFGTNLGYTSVRPASGSRESNRDGYAVHLKLLASRNFGKWVADAGVGYSQHAAGGSDGFSSFSNGTVHVKTRAGFVEFSPRYRLGEHHQLGFVGNGFFGTDVAFDESTTDPNTSFAFAGGLRYDWETSPDTSKRWRFGAQAMHDLGISNREIWWVMADVQFGIPFGSEKTPVVAEPSPPVVVPAESPLPTRPTAPRFAEVMPEKVVKVYLGEAVLRFKTASAELRPSSRMILVKVAKYLNQSPEAWQRLRVEGHADRRGKLEYNMRLSRARAVRVMRELERLRVPADKLGADGFGPNRPIDPEGDEIAFALNRRVELWIDGVVDPDVLVRDLNELK